MNTPVTMRYGNQRSPAKSPATSWQLLWTNPNLSSNFAAQNIALDLSEFDAVYINFANTSGSQYMEHIFLVGEPQFYVRCLGASGSNLRMWSRLMTVAIDEIRFADCGRYQQGTSGSTTDNSLLIPRQIYGIKFG